MALREDLERLRDEGVAQLAGAGGADAVEAARIALLGRNGRLKQLTDAFRASPPDDKRQLGALLNQVKEALEGALAEAQRGAAAGQADPAIDLTLPERARRIGSLHPISQV